MLRLLLVALLFGAISPAMVAADAAASYGLAAAASPGAINATCRRVNFVRVTTVGTAAVNITDGSGGTILVPIVANHPLGTVRIPPGGVPSVAAAAWWVGGANTPAVTVGCSTS